MSDHKNEHPLPPPAFPPGHRRHVLRKSHATGKPAARADDGGLISPDDPIPLRRDPVEQAFISPDDPIPERRLELTPEFADFGTPSPEDGDGEVVGMDMDAHTELAEFVAARDPHVRELINAVGKLAEALKRKGEAGLRTHPDMKRFDATLRAYCVGYLAGRRAEDPREPDELY
jgi:hypothetical protein